jgi:two-component system, NarL family, sensor histidine kinase UhpB
MKAVFSIVRYLGIALLATVHLSAHAGSVKTDSLKAYRAMHLSDNKPKVDSLLQAALECRKTIDIEPLLKQAKALIDRLKYHDAEARWLDLYGVLKRDRSDYSNAIDYHKKALQLAKQTWDKKVQITALNNLGVVYRRLDECELALKYHLDALKLAEAEKDVYSESIALNSIGNIHIVLGHYEEAITYFKQCLPIAKKAKNDLGIAMNLNNIGEAYENMNLLDSAKYYYTRSLYYNRRINIEKGTAIGYNSLGNVLKKQGNVQEAIDLYQKALAINIKLGDKIYVADNYINIGNAFFALKQYAAATQALGEGLKMALSIRSKVEARNAYLGMMSLNEAQGNYKNALKFGKLYKQVADSIINEKNDRNAAQMVAIYEKDKEQQKIVFLEKAQKDSRLLTFTMVVLLALSLIVGSLFLIRHRLLLKNRQLQRELDIRYQIASDLHDDLGSTLSSISIISSVLAQKSSSNEMIGKIFENAQNALKAVDDIIWSVNPKNNKFSNLFVRIKEYALPLFESKNIDFEIIIPETVKTLPLPLVMGRNIYLIIKEAVNNLVKHSGCTRASVVVTHHHSSLEITVIDNGVGFDTEQESNRNGIKNMEERAKQINANFEIQSKKDSGTTIKLRLKPY